MLSASEQAERRALADDGQKSEIREVDFDPKTLGAYAAFVKRKGALVRSSHRLPVRR